MYYNFWDYWLLYHNVTFDGINKLILINNGVTNINFQEDIYSSWKEWVLFDSNSKYLKAIETVGGEPTTGGERLDVTFFLINGWRLKPYPGVYTLKISGNVFEVNGNDIFVASDILSNVANNININTNTSVIVRRLDGVTTDSATIEEIELLFNDQNIQISRIEDKVISIESIVTNIQQTLSQPLDVNIVGQQSDVLTDIHNKLIELWKIHGLDINNNMVVNKNGRNVSTINQTFEKSGDNTIVKRT